MLDLFNGLPEIARLMITLSVIAVAGLGLGQIRVKGIGLGIGGVLFAGLGVGHLAATAGVGFSAPVLGFVREFGLILFVYTIGVQVGPGFVAAFRREGLGLNLMAVAIVVLGALTTVVLHLATGFSLPALLGVFSGAVTNTPALGATQEILAGVHATAEQQMLPSLGYAVAYPFGIAGILIAMILVRVVLRLDTNREAEAFERQRQAENAALETMDVAIRNANLDGATLHEIGLAGEGGVMASRLLRNDHLEVPHPGTRIQTGDVLHLVGPRPELDRLKLFLGQEIATPVTTKGTDVRWERLVVTNDTVLGKSIGQLNLADAYDVVVSRVNRAGIELVPHPALALQFGDILNVIGKPENLARATTVLGNSHRRLQQADFAPVFIGILLGVIVGSIPLFLPGMPAPLKLGLAGGPLIVAIVLSRIGRIGPLVWFMPPAANLALREVGIVLFLAVVGLTSGGHFLDTLVNGDGLAWMACGVVITLVPLLVVGFFARLVGKLNYLSVCGLLAGSMTDPPALAFANALSPSEAPALSYAAVYPLVMCLRILVPQILVLALWPG
ncbi:putative transporter [Pararhodospirillum oryzae]|uniref:Putative transport protein n=1 Tax=Pararhodospirillum oryzae TaxID=478448 RepID=A0A512H564_9PROT|nr:putative transporter [Pararhodospirillum oryzae]GEO80500.1 putative transport protein [Pararhodospirillum oryzae]